MTSEQPIAIRLAHSPDPDDAFMWWAITPDDEGVTPMETGRFQVEPVMADIETLNAASEEATYEVTAISCAQYASVSDQYAVTSCGCSFGERYGPKLVARSRSLTSLDALRADGCTIAVPGMRTTAALVCGMALNCGPERFEAVPFDEVASRVAEGQFDAGVVIHEGQLTYEQEGLHLVVDLGKWWYEQENLPLPLGLNVVRRDLEVAHGRGTMIALTDLLHRSIEYGLAHRDRAVVYAMRYARGVTKAQADQFVTMYVSGLTRDSGDEGERAIGRLLERGAELELISAASDVTIIRPGGGGDRDQV